MDSQDIIEELILNGPSTAQHLASHFNRDRDDIVEFLHELSVVGLVRTQGRSAEGDMACFNCGTMYSQVEADPGDPCQVFRGDGFCDGPIIDACPWVYCGPISAALSGAVVFASV